MELLLVLLLAVVQGITEFLPISSDGHLAVAAALCESAGHPLPDVMMVTIVLHAGTLAAIVIFYWRRLLALLSDDRRVLGLIVLGTIPAVLLGLPLKKFGSDLLTSPLLAGAMLPLNGLMLCLGPRATGQEDYTRLTWRQALLIGTAQALAILPGISRSGTTIVAGLLLGLKRESAATFSFLLAVPAIGGACFLEMIDLYQDGTQGVAPASLIAGAALSLVVGLTAIRWLLGWLARGRLAWFGYWCIALGAAVLAWQLI